jgi:hypothetical protein
MYRAANQPAPVAAASPNIPAAPAPADHRDDPAPPKPPADGKPDPMTPNKPTPPTEAPPAPPTPLPHDPQPDPKPAPPDPKPAPEANPAPAPNAPQDPINQAIDKGVAFLKQHVGQRARIPANPGGIGVFGGGRQVGIDGLIGLALLESGVPADDPAVAAVTDVVRSGAPTCNETYEMAIAIWFLDRLGDPKDEDTIRGLAARLVAGQLEHGKWTYTCGGAGFPGGIMLPPGGGKPGKGVIDGPIPPGGVGKLGPVGGLPGPEMPGQLTDDQLKELMETLEKYDPSQEIPAKKRLAPVCNFIKGKKSEKAQQPGMPGGIAFGAGDLSLTQFAVLGLWVARRHKVPVDRSLLLAEAFVREGQSSDGGWSYQGVAMPGLGGFGGTTDSMTCSGMMELTIGRGVSHSEGTKTEAADPQFEKGLVYLADLFTRGIGAAQPQEKPANAQQSQNLLGVSAKLQLLIGPLNSHEALNQHNLWLKDLASLQAEVEKGLTLDLPDDSKKDLQDLLDQMKKYKSAPAEQKKKEQAALDQALTQCSVLQPGGGFKNFVFGGPGRLLKPGKGNRMNMDDIYCLWSVERLAMVCDLKTIAGHDWYAWGADLLVTHQNDDGSWAGSMPQPVDTCLALLFLKRVNVAKDLTAQLQRVAPVKDLPPEKLKLIAPGETPSPGTPTKSPGDTPPEPGRTKETPKP